MTIDKICPISNLLMQPLCRQKILSKYEVDYFICTHCGLIQTESPYWLDEAYENAISALDTGILHRNIRTRRYLEPMIEILGLGQGTFADIGGGYGTLTRLMRDIGYDCHTHDIYCQNIFAKDFEVKPGTTYSALFSFEILEHLPDPIQFIQEEFLKYSTRTLFFSTQTYNKIPDKNWWYYACDSGQHISFYQQKTLSLLAKAVNCEYYCISSSIHVITDRKIHKIRKYILRHRWCFLLYSLITRLRRMKRTNIFPDHEAAKAKYRG